MIGKGYKLIQNSDVDIDENYGDIENISVDYFLLKDKADIDEEHVDDVKDYVVCSKCGKIWNKDNINAYKCDCGQEFQVDLLKVDNEKKEMKNNISECPCCTRNTTNQSGIVSAFHLNKDSATSLLAQILYETIETGTKEKTFKNNEPVINIDFFGGMTNSFEKKEEKRQKNKQFLAFSDSRQQASFFATFFEYTHNRFLRKRIIWEELIKNGHNPIKLELLVSRLEKEIKEKNLFDTGYNSSEDAWISVLSELLNIDGNYTAEAIGIFAFELDDNFIDDKLNSLGIENALNQLNITKEEFKTILKVCFSVFRSSSAIDYSESALTLEKRKEEFGYRRFTNYVVFKKEPKNNQDVEGDNRRSFVPVKNGKMENQVYNYVKKIMPEKSNEELINFLYGLFDLGIKTGLFKETDGERGEKLYSIMADKYVVKSYKNMIYYRCPICERMTQYNVRNICPTKYCKGVLEKVDPDEVEAENYYRKEYMNKKIERVVVKEHTAQLDRKKGREYQKDFKNQKINVLSCSTTFEMGIDIGHLENVFLRNVPPTPANYAQRAGRAGRSDDASAFVLTFCGSNSHDYTYFTDPTKMIAGHIVPPKLKITNEKIILRHIMASAFGFFFRKKPIYFENIDNLICNGGIDDFKKYLKSKPEDLNNYINNKVLDSNIVSLYGEFKWIDKVLNEDGELQRFYDEKVAMIEELQKAETQAIDEKNYKKAQYFSDEISKIKKDSVIARLSSDCVIPKYGFPVDTVELKVYEDGKEQHKYNLSRDLSIAISEYAPDSEIIVDDKKFTSRYLLKPKTKEDFTRYYYYECPYCERMNVSESITSNIEICKYCNNRYPDVIKNYYVEPVYGFATDFKNKESRTKRPRKTYAGEYKYLGDGVSNNDKIEFNNIVSIESTKDDKLLVLNSNPFFKCPICGYTILDKKRSNNDSISQTKPPHLNYLGYKCANEDRLYKTALGHTFKTDVIKIKVSGLIEKKRALSTLYALIEGISDEFEIERNDINGLINKTDNGEYELIIFDNVPGGAGHVKRILESKNLKTTFEAAYNIVNKNCCDENTSCYNCLRNFNNQRVHSELKRKYAKEILRNIINGLTVQKEDKKEQITVEGIIDYNNSYSLEPYNSWDEVSLFFDKLEKEKYIENSIEIPDYADSYIKLPSGKIVNTYMIWVDKNVVITNTDEDTEEVKKYGIKAINVSKIDYDKIRKELS